MTTTILLIVLTNLVLTIWMLTQQRKAKMTKQEALDALTKLSASLDNLEKEISGLSSEVGSLQDAAKAKADVIGDDLANAINAVANRAGAISAAHSDAAAAMPDVSGAAAGPTLTPTPVVPTPPAPEPPPSLTPV